MAKDSRIQWTDHTFNPWWGCLKISPGCANCLHPDTKILMADWRNIPLKEVKQGDKLITFNEAGDGLRRYEIATVEKVWGSRKRAAHVITENSYVLSSYDHLFLRGDKQTWVATKDMKLTTSLRFLPLYNLYEQTTPDYMAGYLSGMTLGDGTMRFSPAWVDVPHREVSHSIGFEFVLEIPSSQKRASTARLIGGTPKAAELFAVIKPVLSSKTHNVVAGYAKHTIDKVKAIVDLGEMNLIDIQTSTGTFIANGLMTHNCYAETFSKRIGRNIWGPPQTTSRWQTKSPWRDILKWDKEAGKQGIRQRVFCASMSDFFEDHPQVTPWRQEAIPILARLQNLDVQLLTKRPENIQTMVPSWCEDWPPHIWLGVSAEDQQRLDERIVHLIDIPAPIKFLSCEPLLAQLGLSRWLGLVHNRHGWRAAYRPDVQWIIIGGESGPNARPFNLEWARRIIEQAKVADVPVFVKQLGARPYAGENCLGEKHWLVVKGKGDDPTLWSEFFQIREFPNGEKK